MKLLGLILMYISYAGMTDYIYWQGLRKRYQVKTWRLAYAKQYPLKLRLMAMDAELLRRRYGNVFDTGCLLLLAVTLDRIRLALTWPVTWGKTLAILLAEC